MSIQAINSVSPKATQQVAFKGAVADGAAKVLGKIGNSDAFVKGIDKFGSNPSLVPALSTASSVVTTGLYMYKTLTNDKYDKKQKITLALNQGLTFVASQVIQYTILGALKNKKNALANVFADAVAQRSGNPCSKTLKDGASAAIDLATCSFVTRYLSPVAVTPIANKIGDKVTEFLNKRNASKAEQTAKA